MISSVAHGAQTVSLQPQDIKSDNESASISHLWLLLLESYCKTHDAPKLQQLLAPQSLFVQELKQIDELPFHFIARHGKPEVIKTLCTECAQADILYAKDKYDRTVIDILQSRGDQQDAIAHIEKERARRWSGPMRKRQHSQNALAPWLSNE